MVSFLAGLNLGVQGDSIAAIFNNAWQNVVTARTGMILNPINQNARAGRNMTQAFEVYGTTTPGSALLVNQGTINTPLGPVSTGTPGDTLAQDLVQIDLMIVALGTNDASFPLGNLGDPTNAGTYYGNMRWIAETYLSAKPSLRLVFVTPQYSGFGTHPQQQQMAEAMADYGKSMGIPVINMFALGGVNALTAPTLTRDGTHPSDYGFAHFYGPVIAQGLQQIF
jgi:lysophospholipase L1-like esterase